MLTTFFSCRPQNTGWNYSIKPPHHPDVPNFLKKWLLLCLGAHLQLSPINLTKKYLPWGCTCTQCTPWLRLWKALIAENFVPKYLRNLAFLLRCIPRCMLCVDRWRVTKSLLCISVLDISMQINFFIFDHQTFSYDEVETTFLNSHLSHAESVALLNSKLKIN